MSIAASRSGLRRFVAERGGISLDDACAAADQAIENIRETSVKLLMDQVACICGYDALIDAPPPSAVLWELHRLAQTISSTAGLFGLGALGLAARSLCDLIDTCHDAKLPAAIHVHADGLKAIASGAIPETHLGNLLNGLARVVESVKEGAQ